MPGGGGGEGFSVKLPIPGKSAQKGYLFQALGLSKGREICHFGGKKAQRANRCILWLRKSVLVF